MNQKPRRLLIIGASTRAAAWSAWRAGFQPVCIDAFADRDLLQVAEVIPAEYPAGIVRSLADVTADGWMFVGAMENHRRVIRRLQQLPQLGSHFGPPMSAIEALRDPNWLAERLKRLQCYPKVATASGHRAQVPDDAATIWLCKPLQSGGGIGIHEAKDPAPDSFHFHQKFIPGTPMSALYCVTSKGYERLIVCEQLIGLAESSPPSRFAFCGAIAAPKLNAAAVAQLDAIVETLIQDLDYRGLIGLDLVWDCERLWLIEVNPRYTASTELWELATRRSAVAEHIAAFDHRADISSALSPRPRPGGEGQGEGTSADSRIYGKAILFADHDVVAPNLDQFLQPSPWSLRLIADIPATGSEIPKGAPICSVFATGNTIEDCRCKLRARLDRVRRWFHCNEPRTQ